MTAAEVVGFIEATQGASLRRCERTRPSRRLRAEDGGYVV